MNQSRSNMVPIVIGIFIIFIAGSVVWYQNNQQNSYSSANTQRAIGSGSAPSSGGNSSSPSTTGGTSSSSAGDNSTTYTMADVAKHNSAASCWSAINGTIYDLTSWIAQHPGGQEHILAICGIDGSAAFNTQHGSQGRPNQILATFKIGTLSF